MEKHLFVQVFSHLSRRAYISPIDLQCVIFEKWFLANTQSTPCIDFVQYYHWCVVLSRVCSIIQGVQYYQLCAALSIVCSIIKGVQYYRDKSVLARPIFSKFRKCSISKA